MPPAARRRNRRPQIPFNRKLVVNQWLLGLFGVERFDQLAEHLRDESLEGLDENNVNRFHHALCLHLPAEKRPELPDEMLLEYDQAIVSTTARLNERIEFVLPIIRNLGKRPLKTIRLKKKINSVSTEFGDAFRRLGPIPSVQPPDPATDPAGRNNGSLTDGSPPPDSPSGGPVPGTSAPTRSSTA